MHSRNPSPRTRRMTLLSGLVATGVVLAGGAAYAVPAAGTPTVEAPAAVDEGDTFTVTVSLPATTDVFAYSATLAFDSDLVAYVDDSATGPDGGFASTSTTADAVVFTHTRLGGSPALDGDLVLFSADFTAIAGGTAPFDLAALTLVGADTDELVVDTSAVVAAETEITPEDDGGGVTPTPEPSGEPTPEPSGEPTPDASGEPTPEPTDAVGDGVSVDGPGADGLSDTGASPAGLIIAAAIALALGITLVVRKSVMTR